MNKNLGTPIYQDGQELILAVTKMLNQTELPEVLGNWYIRVELVDGQGTKFGEWSDEIAPDAWAFSPYKNPIDPEGK